MIRLSLFVVCSIITLGCGPSTPTRQEPPPAIFDVNYRVLVRDLPTASSYTGRRVRVRIDRSEYVVVDHSIHLWATERGARPALILHFMDTPPAGVNLTVTGTCGSPVEDGLWRGPRCDFSLTVTDCAWTVR